MTVNIFAMQTLDEQTVEDIHQIISNTYGDLSALHISMHSKESLVDVLKNCKATDYWLSKLSKNNAQFKNMHGLLLNFKNRSFIFHAMINEALVFYNEQIKTCGKQMVKLNIAIKDRSILKIQEQSSNAVYNYGLLTGIMSTLQEIESLIPKDIE
jgi:hypothetical protein